MVTRTSLYRQGRWGVKGMLPWGCFSRWGREGVTLKVSLNVKKYGQQKDFYSAKEFILSIIGCHESFEDRIFCNAAGMFPILI